MTSFWEGVRQQQEMERSMSSATAPRPSERMIRGGADLIAACIAPFLAAASAELESRRRFIRRSQRSTQNVVRNMLAPREVERRFWEYYKKLANHSQEEPFPEMHENAAREMFISMLPLIYGESLAANAGDLCERYNCPTIMNRTLICWPRRHGKSESVAAFSAAASLAFPCSIHVFSNSDQTSDEMKQKTLYYLRFAADDKLRVVRDVKGKLIIAPLCGGSKMSRLRFFPANPVVRMFFFRVPRLKCKVCIPLILFS